MKAFSIDLNLVTLITGDGNYGVARIITSLKISRLETHDLCSIFCVLNKISDLSPVRTSELWVSRRAYYPRLPKS